MVVLPAELTRESPPGGRQREIRFCCWDGDVYNAFLAQTGDVPGTVRGSLSWLGPSDALGPEEAGTPTDAVRVLAMRTEEEKGPGCAEDSAPVLRAFIRDGGTWHEVATQVVAAESELFSRSRGLLESDALSGKLVAHFGLGSVGASVAVLLAQSGVTNHVAVDGDRLEAGNMARHDAGLSHVGRLKTDYVAYRIREKNPYAHVEKYATAITGENLEDFRSVVRRSSLVVCSIDDREGKLLVNRLCLEEGKVCIFAGAFRRAYGGQVLRVIPGVSSCYQCFIRRLPEEADGLSSSRPGEGQHQQYTDRPTTIEPGLAVDIAPINAFAAKLCVQELLRGKETTLRSLDEDLVAHWYLYLNRRETDTQYEQLRPLGFGLDGLRILRWYGVSAERDPRCQACGDYLSILAGEHGIDLAELQDTEKADLPGLLDEPANDLPGTSDRAMG